MSYASRVRGVPPSSAGPAAAAAAAKAPPMSFAAAAKRSLSSTSETNVHVQQAKNGHAQHETDAEVEHETKEQIKARTRSVIMVAMDGLRGCTVLIDTTEGRAFEGVYQSTGQDSFSISMAQEVSGSDSGSKNMNPFVNSMRFEMNTVACVHSKGIPPIVNPDAVMGFRTDTQISTPNKLENRQLQKWDTSTDAQEAPGDGGEQQMSLDHEARIRAGERGWDQFAVNKRLFGYESSYQEEDYTTRVDRDSAFYRRNERTAARLAREIQTSSSTNVHVAEERGQDVRSNLNPEQAYSSVLTDEDSGKYKIPAKRNPSPPKKKPEPKLKPKPEPQKTPAPTPTPQVETKAKQPDSKPKKEPEAKPKPAAKPPSRLNPKAKEFSLNVGAKEFVPSFGAPPAGAYASAPAPMMQMQQGPVMPVYTYGQMPFVYAAPNMYPMPPGFMGTPSTAFGYASPMVSPTMGYMPQQQPQQQPQPQQQQQQHQQQQPQQQQQK